MFTYLSQTDIFKEKNYSNIGQRGKEYWQSNYFRLILEYNMLILKNSLLTCAGACHGEPSKFY